MHALVTLTRPIVIVLFIVEPGSDGLLNVKGEDFGHASLSSDLSAVTQPGNGSG